jgi:hypothetical protein
MVDQAQVTARPGGNGTGVNGPGGNGRTELPPRAVARSSAEFLHDITTLAELQGKLLLIDLQEGVQKLVISAIMVVLGTIIALGTVPIGLAAIALTLAYFQPDWPLAAHFGIALAIGVVLAAALAIPALYAIKKNVWMFDRSRDEWLRNTQWAKDAMRRMSGRATTPPATSRRW